MPLYEISHITHLTESQRDDLASEITKIHSQIFATPSLFVNIHFNDISEKATYIGGKKVGIP